MGSVALAEIQAPRRWDIKKHGLKKQKEAFLVSIFIFLCFAKGSLSPCCHWVFQRALLS